MRIRCCAAVIVGVVCAAAVARAEPRAEIAAKTKAAMASYDALDYDAARRLLNQALAIAKRAKLDRDPIVARVYLDLGIAQLASSDQEAAKVALLSAVQIDPRIAIEPAYKSAELVRMLDEARAAASDTGEPAGDDCRTRAIQVIVDGARRGVAQPVEVVIGGDVSPARVVAMYRPEGAIDFTEARLTRRAGCRYAGTIPAAAMHGPLLHYYVAAYDANNKVLAAKGSSGSPNVLELGGAASHADDPAGTGPPLPPPSDRGAGGDVVDQPGQPARGPKRPTVMLAVSGGTGFGYVTGKTEGENMVQKCCIGSSPVVVTAELGYRMTPRLSLGAVGRLGLPIGANIMGHSNIAPAGFVRLGYAFADSGDGVHVMGEVGFGILRNTIKLDTNMPGMDTDIVAQGPLLFGTGIGFTKHLSPALALVVDLDALAAAAIVNKLSTAINLNSGISADLRLGLAVGF
ncbi:MAG: tetratricopeptide repeat protein [Deltaproteobacteria bacterium]|nr:MAG: tetratricopeptide repeat protein [Deltaproteobacteria bacterium]TMQ18126.1 MAG: tetratricopeptide repeat protein [Deltaproteobacteria bacterium]